MKSVAFVTSTELGGIAPDDRIAAEALSRLGVSVQGVVWDDPVADWAAYDAVVIRSCWDYFYYPDEFVAWMNALEYVGVRVFNPIPIVRWNYEKK